MEAEIIHEIFRRLESIEVFAVLGFAFSIILFIVLGVYMICKEDKK